MFAILSTEVRGGRDFGRPKPVTTFKDTNTEKQIKIHTQRRNGNDDINEEEAE